MKIQKRLAALLFAVMMLLAMSVTAYAHEVPDRSRTGSISVTMTYDGKAVSGGTMTLYQVGRVCENDGDYSFDLTDVFAGSNVSLDDLSSAALADTLAAYASENNIAGTATVVIGNDGKATAGGLKPGLYLVVQTQAADGFEAAAPFIVSIPVNEDGTYIYDVDATPKMGLLTEKTPVPPNPPTSVTPPTPAIPGEPILPQTGQLNWPVPILAVLGLCLILLGFTLRCSRKGQQHEA